MNGIFLFSGNLKKLLIETPQNPLPKQKFNPAVGWNNTTHHNAVGVNLLYFNNFLFRPIGWFGGLETHPTVYSLGNFTLKFSGNCLFVLMYAVAVKPPLR